VANGIYLKEKEKKKERDDVPLYPSNVLKHTVAFVLWHIKTYKELKRILRLSGSDLSVDKVLNIAEQ
jgi:hypothetical protein